MHELGIAGEIVTAAVAEARRHHAGRVTGVKVQVGVLRGIVPESLRLFFTHASRETVAENARLEVDEEPLTIECGKCGETPAYSLTLSCPRCGDGEVRIRGGDSLRIVSVELDV